MERQFSFCTKSMQAYCEKIDYKNYDMDFQQSNPPERPPCSTRIEN